MSKYHIHEHTLPTSYIREWPRAVARDQEGDLRIAIKQYTPRDNGSPKAGDITIISAHANGFPKVLTLRGHFMCDLALTGPRSCTSRCGMSCMDV